MSGSTYSRRNILAAAAAAVGATVFRALDRPALVRAAGNDGNPMLVGGFYPDAQSQTTLADKANNERVLWVASNDDLGMGAGVAVTGFSSKSTGVEGWSKTGTGLYGHTDGSLQGVRGVSVSGNGVRGESQQHGVHGQGAGASSVAVYADQPHATGYAIRSSGRVRFDKVSGVATIPAGTTSVTVTPGVDVTTSSFVLLTPMANIGARSLWFSLDTTNNRITLRISSTRTVATKVGWLLMR